jgi:DNA repair protein RecO (recombination protein O)
VARGARKLKSRFGAGLEPFTLINLSYYEREGRDLVSARHLEIIRSYFGVSGSTEVVGAMAYLSELVVEFAPPHEPDEKMFRMVRACADALAQGPEGLSSVVLYFEVWILRLSGFLPDWRACSECGLTFTGAEPLYVSAEFKARCAACGQGRGLAVTEGARAQLRAAQRLPPTEFAQRYCGADSSTRSELGQLTRRLIERVLERRPRAQFDPKQSALAP